MNTFISGKKYIFSRDKWLMVTGNVLLYKGNPHLRQIVDKADGEEITDICKTINCGYAGRLVVHPQECDIAESKRRTTFREAVNRLLLRDKQAQLHEAINMLVSDKKRLEQRLRAINKELAQREQELFETEKELMK